MFAIFTRAFRKILFETSSFAFRKKKIEGASNSICCYKVIVRETLALFVFKRKNKQSIE